MCVAAVSLAVPVVGAQGRGTQEQLSESYRGSQRNNVEYQKVPPIKIFDNLYYVGPGYVSVWLIPTSDGVILIDTAEEPYVDHVIGNIRKAGFELRQIRYIVISQGHVDHFGGAARIQELSGARVVALAEDWNLIEAAGVATPNRAAIRVPKRDFVVKDGEMLTVGSTTFRFYKTSGHTPGTLSSEFTVFDNGTPHKAFMMGGSGPRGGLEAAMELVESARRVAQVPGVEVAVQTHSWLNSEPYPNGGVFERAQKLAQRRPGDPHPFVDPASWRQWIQQVQTGAARNLEEQKQKSGR
jgi:metallo-beta-lactamase class B